MSKPKLTQEQKDMISLARSLYKAAVFADAHDITLNNGAFVGSIVAAIADELAVRASFIVSSLQ